jgi:methyl-accepting chemotaxis protein
MILTRFLTYLPQIHLGLRAKLMVLGASVLIATLILAGMSIYASNQINDAMRLSMKSQMQVSMVNDIRQKQLHALFGALAAKPGNQGNESDNRLIEIVTKSLDNMVEKSARLEKQTANSEVAGAASAAAAHLRELAGRIRAELNGEDSPQSADSFEAYLLASEQKMASDLRSLGGQLSQGNFMAMKINHAAIDLAQKGSIYTAAISLLIVISTLVWIGYSTIRPVRGMTATMLQLAEGDHSVEIPGVGRKDEIGEMSSAVEVFKDNAIRNEQLKAEQKVLEQKAAEEKKQLMRQMADEFEQKVGRLLAEVTSEVERLQGTAQDMAGTAKTANGQAATVAAACEEASANINVVASASQELSQSIRSITEQMDQSRAASSTAVVKADHSRETVAQLVESAQRIGDIVEIINDIASGTNLLALNATIEAARAGEHGKGFAVVANEVKHLANQTAKATEDIQDQVNNIQAVIKVAATSMEEIGSAIGEVNDYTGTVSGAVSEQEAATTEIARNIEMAAQGSQQVTLNIAGVADSTDKTKTAAADISHSATGLADRATELRDEVHDFLMRLSA